MKILKFNWDTSKGEDYNGNHLIIAQHLPKKQNEEMTHLECYGITFEGADTTKDLQLKQFTCWTGNIVGEVVQITKDEARKLLIEKIDESLNILFDKNEIEEVDEKLNVYPPEEDEEDEYY